MTSFHRHLFPQFELLVVWLVLLRLVVREHQIPCELDHRTIVVTVHYGCVVRDVVALLQVFEQVAVDLRETSSDLLAQPDRPVVVEPDRYVEFLAVR